MGEFTTKYKTTYSDGTSQVDDRLDMGKVSGGAFTYGIVALALIALVPALVLLPLFLYVYFVLKHLKGFKSIDSSYQNELLKTNGYKDLGSFIKFAKLRSWFLILVMIGAVVTIDYLSFTSGHTLFGSRYSDSLFIYQLKISVYLLGLYWVVPFIINKDRFMVKNLFGLKKLNFLERLYNKKLKLFMLGVVTPTLIVGLFMANSTYLLIKSDEITHKNNLFDYATYSYRPDVVKTLNATAKKGDVDSEFLNKKIYNPSPLDKFLIDINILASFGNKPSDWYSSVMYYAKKSDNFHHSILFELHDDEKPFTMKLHQLADLCLKHKNKSSKGIKKCNLDRLVRTFKRLGGDINAVDYFGNPLVISSRPELAKALIKAGAKN